MRKGKKQIVAVLILAMSVQLFGNVDFVVAAKKPKLNKTKLILKVGQKKKLKVKNYKKKVKWSSSKKKIASVSRKGLVKAKKAGAATITAKVGQKKLRCKVRVKNANKTLVRNTPAAPNNTGSITTSVPVSPSVSVIPKPSKAPLTSASPKASEAPGASVSPKASEIPFVSESPKASKAPLVSESPKASATPFVSALPEVSPMVSGIPTSSPETSAMPLVSASPEASEAPTVPPEVSPSVSKAPAAPVFSRESGTYESAFTLDISADSGSNIYYTTDGSDPRTSASRKMYQSGISIQDRSGDSNVLSAVSPNRFDTMEYYISGNEIFSNNTTPGNADVDKCSVIRAVAEDADGNMGTVATSTYFIGKMSKHISGIAESAQAAGQKLSIISITMDQADLFDEETGIYVRGKYFTDSLNQYIKEHGSLNGINVEGDLDSNFKQKGRAWERNCHIEYFESDGEVTNCALKQDCGIRIQGNYSRLNVQKSFRLYAREEYGVKNFKYPFFDGLKNAKGEQMKKFKTLVLRNGGNDSGNYKYKDILTQSFVHDLELETLHGRPCVVYLDGEYWGYYILQDDISDNFLQERRGVLKEDVVAYKGSDDKKYAEYRYKLDEGELPAGVTNEDYYLKDTLDYLREHDFSDNSVYQTFVQKYMSEQSAIDYFATNLFLNNGYDWPGKNWEIWRVTKKDTTNPYADGLWRFCLFDLDLTTEPTWSTDEWNANRWSYDTVSHLYNKDSDNVIQMIFSNMLDNAAFQQKLKEKIQVVAEQNYENATVQGRAEQYRAIYSPLHAQFCKRFVKNTTWTAEANHKCNVGFYAKRMNYLPTLLNRIDSIVAESSN